MVVRRSKETREGGHTRSLSWEPNSLTFQKLLVLSTVVFPFRCIGPRVWAVRTKDWVKSILKDFGFKLFLAQIFVTGHWTSEFGFFICVCSIYQDLFVWPILIL
ncbi:hypothetical protein ES288_A03G136300v1 [Gossypium darwinii]|uniref:Uncharacterized protein n=1 Tax=Gossypium darwinii TaxID=34276 RepID=A0A5D2H664_GOSDA|nr:hypothetical protein ES288_A03G136300v1 [Gossypium darwinii]